MKNRYHSTIRIDAVVVGDFRTSDATQSRVFRRLLQRMGTDDVLVLVSMSGDQLRFMRSPKYYENGLIDRKLGSVRAINTVLEQRTLRVTDGGMWTPIHIKNWCEQEGYTLVNYEALVKHWGFDTNYGRGGTENDDPPPPTAKSNKGTVRPGA